MADPRFPRRGGRGATPVLGRNLLFGKIFAENCMKMKKIEPREASLPPPLDPSMVKHHFTSGVVNAHAPVEPCGFNEKVLVKS